MIRGTRTRSTLADISAALGSLSDAPRKGALAVEALGPGSAPSGPQLRALGYAYASAAVGAQWPAPLGAADAVFSINALPPAEQALPELVALNAALRPGAWLFLRLPAQPGATPPSYTADWLRRELSRAGLTSAAVVYHGAGAQCALYAKAQRPWGENPTHYPDGEGLSFFTTRELNALTELLPTSGSFLEVGSANGATAAEVLRRRPQATALCVDTYWPDPNLPESSAEHPEHRLHQWLLNSRLRDGRMRLWLGDLRSLCEHELAVRFDLALVDANHDREFVLDDLTRAAPLVKPGGMLVAHDYGDNNWPGVTAGIHDFIAGGPWTVEVLAGSLAALRRTE